ncbi:DUF2786 domain-containing protein [Marinomonas pollencensis]|uniref:Uncharacterized protein DUF2786 n=1 Tax=Marinomonas pollencensis TaxID=491954 RepID=A0A3E0D6T9_9GAMM|nr:DUF2786 domain-containing protein [Marinomonas pollencensis]REG78267.1 uncharacterized protein DUF2786 [Marinomonas pollencensis]
MSTRRRKKAISKIVKLLNLATSTNTTESIVALRHAESLIRQYNIKQGELPMVQLCDRTLLYKVSWGNAAPRFPKEKPATFAVADSVYQRRFSEKRRATEKNEWPADESVSEGGDTSKVGATEAAPESMVAQDATTKEESVIRKNKMNESMDAIYRAERSDVDGQSAVYGAGNTDNVIDAAQAFRPEVQVFTDALKSQQHKQDMDMAFTDDAYWARVHDALVDFDEAAVQTEIDTIKRHLQQSERFLSDKKADRHKQEKAELQERAERAKIELSFEAAIERAFQARAKAYEAWEKEQYRQRLNCLREEQQALAEYESLSKELTDCEASLHRHLQRKQDYQAAKIMHDLRRHLALAASGDDEAASAFDVVVEMMQLNGLSLKDLEFSDIQNKSVFIRLLEKESAQIPDAHQRELFTEEMLDKFLNAKPSARHYVKDETPLQHIQRLLTAATQAGQYEAQKQIEQVQRLMASHEISVRDIGYGFIKKYSVFISLINWEAERIATLPEREAFTAQILEEYIQFSVQVPDSSSGQKMTP